MLLRGLIVALSGFLFIFAPGLPIGLIARRLPHLDRGLIYRGIAAWLVALLPSLFLQSLLRQFFDPGETPPPALNRPLDYLLTFAGSILTATFVVLGIRFLLRRQTADVREGGRNPEHLHAGLALGIGVGLIDQIFTGLSLVGAGFRLMFGPLVSEGFGVQLTQTPLLALTIGLVAVVLYRPALLVVGAATGALVARARVGDARSGWLAIAVYALFPWTALALQLALSGARPGLILAGDIDPLTAIVLAGYYLLVFGLAYRWLAGEVITSSSPASC